MRVILTLFLLLPGPILHAAWWKGNLHTHTSESDGDSSPAAVVAWYASHGYDFLVITDHDKVTKAASDAILLIPGEEITDRLGKKPLHVNAIGIDEAIAPQKGSTPAEVLQRNIDAVRKAGGIALLNHPNFGWAYGTSEMLQLDGATLLEIASGHQYVNAQGPPSVETMWDALLTSGKRIWGVAVDDMHHLGRAHEPDSVPPGRAWIVVRAEKRETKAILDAIRRGDFYASTGPELEESVSDETSWTLRVREKNGARYRIQFLGPNGTLLQESGGPSATYAFRGDEGYVRARVLDSNGRTAWLQPLFPRKR